MLKKPPIVTTTARPAKIARLAKKKTDQKLIQKFIFHYSL
jgi:hypothetical protein